MQSPEKKKNFHVHHKAHIRMKARRSPGAAKTKAPEFTPLK
jgi:hypothetical protein